MYNVKIVSWLLTRRCNLKCSYCRISKNYNSPEEYPKLGHYIKNEMNTGFILESLRRLHLHNSNIFNIFYGGEPMLRDDLVEIVNYCNSNKIAYTIITNNSEEVKSRIDNLIANTDFIQGLTSSVDPIIYNMDDKKDDRLRKSYAGMKGLVEWKDYIKDVVAEITVDSETIQFLPDLVDNLTTHGISSDITFVDISKSPYYDFSDVTDESNMVTATKQTANVFQKILQSDADIHMKDPLLFELFNILPSKLDCEIESGLHNLTIDADGSVRLCLRIRGVEAPKNSLLHYLSPMGDFDNTLLTRLVKDKHNYCKLCNWSCMIMSKLLLQGRSEPEQLIHTARRET